MEISWNFVSLKKWEPWALYRSNQRRLIYTYRTFDVICKQYHRTTLKWYEDGDVDSTCKRSIKLIYSVRK